MRAGRRLIFTGILLYPLAIVMCLMLVRGAPTPATADPGLMILLYAIAGLPLVVIVAGTVLLQRNR